MVYDNDDDLGTESNDFISWMGKLRFMELKRFAKAFRERL